MVGWKISPDHETPTDAGSDNVYNLEVKATEAGNTHTVTQTVAITVTDVGDLAPAFTSGSSASFAENGTGAVYTAVVAPDVAGRSVTFSISGGPDAARFSINSSSGVVSFISVPDHESATDLGSNNVYEIVIRATESGNTFLATRSVAVTVINVAEAAPVFTSGSSAAFAENGTGAVYTTQVTPNVTGAAVSYSISGDDSAKFSIDSSSGVVNFVSSPDFETKTDADSNNIYGIVIQATESGSTFVVTRSVAVTVQDVAEFAPTFTSASSVAFAENGAGVVYTALAAPAVTGRSVVYSISGGADSAKFSINSSSGVVGFKSSPNFENPTDSGSDNVYDIVIQATEAGNTFVVTQAVAVTVLDVGEAAPAFTSGSSASFAENGTGAVYTAVVAPDVAGRSVTFSISGGPDAARFSINSSSGVVSFISVPDHESATDLGSNNVYEIVIRATESGNTFLATRSVAVTVINVAEAAPVFTSGSSAAFAENGTGAVYTTQVTPNVTGAAVSYSISGGDDSAKFSIDSSSGVVNFVSSPDFETKTDADSNNIYGIVIQATESGSTFVVTRSVAVTVQDVAEFAPTFTSASSVAFAENGAGVVYTALAAPAVTGRSVVYSISGGADSAKFSINSSSGVVGFKSSPNFENPTDSGSDNVYDIVIQATEAGNTFVVTQAVAVTVLDVGEAAPAFTSGSSASFAENGTGAVYTAVVAPDVAGRSVTFSISGGPDAARFSINSSSGVVSFISVPDHESATDLGSNNVYEIVIRATEANNTHTVTQTVAVTVTDVGDVAPTFTSGGSASFAENGIGAVYTAVATPDVTGAAVSYRISGGDDSAQFSINSSSGVVSFVSSPDFENPTDAGSGNGYDIVIQATESGNTFVTTRSVTVTVSNVVETAPRITSGGSASFAENGTGAVYTVRASASDGDGSISYSISGGADSAQFSINSSGVVSFKNSPDFETPTDAGNDNIYNLEVKATEAGNAVTATRSVAVTVSNVVETAPSITSGSSATFAENATGAVYTVRASASDGDGSITYSISGGADSAQFSINSSSGVVSFISSPNHESPTDAGSDNVYNLEVKATEANNTQTVTQTVAITVTDVGDVAPSVTSGGSASFAENATGAVYTAVATPDVTGASIGYSISGGDDSAQFSINSSSGVVSFISSPDFENPTDAGSDNGYDIVIQATESGNTFVTTRSVTVTVSNVVETAPSITSGGSASFAENGTGAVYTVRASASDGDGSISYSISGGADSAQFSINSSSGVVSFKNSPTLKRRPMRAATTFTTWKSKPPRRATPSPRPAAWR